MSDNHRFMSPAYDLHAYQPIVIDEDCLTPEDRRARANEAMLAFASGRGVPTWKEYLTPAELSEYENAPIHRAAHYLDGISRSQPERDRVGSRGANRAYACRKYNQGRRIYYGDRLPFDAPPPNKGSRRTFVHPLMPAFASPPSPPAKRQT